MVVTAVPALSRNPLPDGLLRRKPLIVIVGPTAVGKSQIALEVAKEFETEILAADSRQIYCGMDIGTDKPPPEGRQGIPHQLIDLVQPNVPFNAGRYRHHAVSVIERLHADRALPLIVGGTGLYIRTLLQGLCEAPPCDPALRAKLTEEAQELGPNRFYAQLVAVDPITASKLHPRDTSKVIRALEVQRLSGRPISEFQRQHGFAERPFAALLIGLDREREDLYRRIENRIDWQLTHGLVEETQRLLAQGYRREDAAMKGLGYRQIAAHLAGECDRTEMVRRFKRDTRRYAKRQMTWFRKEPGIVWLMISESEPIAETADRVIYQIKQFLASLELGCNDGDVVRDFQGR